MREKLTIFNAFVHDVATGTWIGTLVLLTILHRETSRPAWLLASPLVPSLERKFLVLTWVSLGVILATGVVRMITDPASQPLDVGRQTRTVSPAQARAVIHRDRHCRIHDCHAPPWACDIHHIREWIRDRGPTDLANLLLVCWYHHHQLHDSGGQLRPIGDGHYVIEPRAGCPAAA